MPVWVPVRVVTVRLTWAWFTSPQRVHQLASETAYHWRKDAPVEMFKIKYLGHALFHNVSGFLI